MIMKSVVVRNKKIHSKSVNIEGFCMMECEQVSHE